MIILELLAKHKNSKICFNGTLLSYGHFHDLLIEANSSGEGSFHWNGDWTPEKFLLLLSALSNNTPVYSSVILDDELPDPGPGNIAFRTSGTEGVSKWVIHPYAHFLEGKTLQLTGPLLALLFPSHAAGFDFMFHCLRSGADFGFSNLQNLNSSTINPRTIFGPPQSLAALLFFHSKNEELLRRLKEFYISGDSLSPVIAARVKSLGYDFKVKQFYGSSETMMIWTEENPDRPWLINFLPGEVEIKNNLIHYTGKTLAQRSWTQDKGFQTLVTPYELGDNVGMEDGWFNLFDNQRNLTKVWGHTINVKRIENDLFKLSDILDARVEVKDFGIMGPQLIIHLWSEKEFAEGEMIESFPEMAPIRQNIKVQLHRPESITLEKKKRITSGKRH